MENIVSRVNTMEDIIENLDEKDRMKFNELVKNDVNQINLLLDGMEKSLINFTIPKEKLMRERVLIKNLFYFYWHLRERIESMTDEEVANIEGIKLGTQFE